MALESNLFKEAIADAKAVRQTALANAKVALEEAFSERYHAMFAEKLKEDAAAMDSAPAAAAPQGAEENVSEQEIDELIKELEAEVGGEQQPPVEPDADDAGMGAPAMGAPAAAPSPFGAPPAVPGAVPPGCPPVGGPAVPGVAPMGAPMGDPAMGAPAPFGAPVDGAPMGAAPAPVAPPPSDVPPIGGEEADEDVNLDELLESLKEEVEKEEEEAEEIDEQKKLASSAIGGKAGGSDNKKPSSSASSTSGIESGGLKQQGVPSPTGTKVGPEDATKAARPNEAKNATSTNLSTPSLGGQSGPALKAARPNSKGDFENTAALEENRNLKKQLAEATETITYVKGQLNEINLLNAKLLYTHKLFKEYNMNNEQKMRIVEMYSLNSLFV